MKKLIFPIVFIYLAAILENSFLNYFLVQGRSLDLILTTFLLILFLYRRSYNHLLLIGLWAGFILDIFRYPGFGTGLTAILILFFLYQGSQRWITRPKKISGFLIWFLIYNLLFYVLVTPLSHANSFFFHYFSSVPTIILESLGIQVFLNTVLAGLIFLLYRKSKKVFLRKDAEIF